MDNTNTVHLRVEFYSENSFEASPYGYRVAIITAESESEAFKILKDHIKTNLDDEIIDNHSTKDIISLLEETNGENGYDFIIFLENIDTREVYIQENCYVDLSIEDWR